MAMVLLFIAVVIVVVFVYLLLWPQNNLFDRFRTALKDRGKGSFLSKMGFFKKKNVVSQNGVVGVSGK